MALQKLDVKELLKESSKLPPLPAVALQIVKVANDPTTAAEDISRIMSIDQSLSAKVLRLVNSSYYGMKNKISSVKQAVVILGFESVRSLALSTAIMEKFSTESEGGLARLEFWKHSFGVAMTGRVLARHIGKSPEIQEQYYMAGLLHDIGKVILDEYFNEHLMVILDRVKHTDSSFYDVERQINDVSHDEIGAFLAAQWRLPPEIQAAIRYHHEPMAAPAQQEIVCATHFANILTKIKGLGSGGDDKIDALSEEAIAFLGIGEDEVGAIVEVEMEKEFSGAEEILRLLE